MYTIAAQNVPTTPSDLNQFKLLWEREVALSNSALLIDCDNLEATDTAREGAIAHLCEWLCSLVAIATTGKRRARHRPSLAFDIGRPTTREQYNVWHEALGTTATSLNGHVDALVTQFNLSVPVIRAACSQVRIQWQQQESQKNADFKLLLWDSCRAQARPKLWQAHRGEGLPRPPCQCGGELPTATDGSLPGAVKTSQKSKVMVCLLVWRVALNLLPQLLEAVLLPQKPTEVLVLSQAAAAPQSCRRPVKPTRTIWQKDCDANGFRVYNPNTRYPSAKIVLSLILKVF